jgi:tetratricopeptide (TPR) repeat protein
MRTRRPLAAVLLFAVGVATGAFAAKKITVSPAAFQGREPKAAAAELLSTAAALAEAGSWENIAVGRVHYLSGDKAAGQAIFDRVLAGGKVKAGDVVRVARVYAEAGEWAKAKPLFDRVLSMAPEDEDWLAEVGAHYLVQGDRAKAEELFQASLRQDPGSLYNTLRMAAAYLGIAPRE